MERGTGADSSLCGVGGLLPCPVVEAEARRGAEALVEDPQSCEGAALSW